MARAASARVLALQPTVEQQREEIERVQRRAEEVGMVEKTAGQSGVAGSMQRGWQKWISSALGAQAAARVEAGKAPTLEDMKAFQTYKYLNRETYSSVGRQGCGDEMGSLQIPYMLGKFVFPMMRYKGWTGLSLAEAKAKNKPLADALRDNWKALKVQQPDATLEGHAQPKKKWDDQVYFVAQDICMADTLRPNRAGTRLAVSGSDGLCANDVLPLWVVCQRQVRFGRQRGAMGRSQRDERRGLHVGPRRFSYGDARRWRRGRWAGRRCERGARHIAA